MAYGSMKIIDRTIPEICSVNKSVSKDELKEFYVLLGKIGVGFFEINSPSAAILDVLPDKSGIIYRIESEKDINICIKNKIRNFIISDDMLGKAGAVEKIYRMNSVITLECRVSNPEEFNRLKKLGRLASSSGVKYIRISGMDGFVSSNWVNMALQLSKSLGKRIDICPYNSLYNATSIAVEGLMNGIRGFTSTFTGIGGDHGYAALEEVAAAVKVLMKSSVRMNLKLLPEASRLFTKLTGIDIPYGKPVLGRGIFRYESGIHADGIHKNAMTYEPFDPGIVGQCRSLSIGKHSGRRSLEDKLGEMGLSFDPGQTDRILEFIRQRSIEFKRGLFDDEIREICRSVAVV